MTYAELVQAIKDYTDNQETTFVDQINRGTIIISC